MKKKIIFAIGCFLALGGTTSCVDLDQEPKSWITEEEYIELPQDVVSVEKAATGLYRNLWGGNYDFCCRMLRLGASADQMASNPTKPLQYLIDLQPSIGLNKGDDWNSPWGNFWNIITASNKILNGTPIPSDPEEAKKFNAALAEVHFMRALAYFHLVRLFGDVPLITSQTEAISEPDRSPVADIYNKIIIPDLTTAIANLPTVSRSGSSDTPSKWAAKTMLADVYLTMAGWPLKLGKEYYAKAAAEAKDVINNAGISLEPTYAGLWQEATKTTVKEHLFAVHNSVADKTYSQYGTSFYPINYWSIANNKGGGWADYYGDPDYMASYPAGARKDYNYMTKWIVKENNVVKEVTWQESQHGFPCISKYRGYDNGALGFTSAQSGGLTPVYRYADVLLFYAEASVQATGTVDALALKCLQDVQTRAGESPLTTTTDATAFDKAIFNEYGWEFLVEGAKRWFQVVRREKLSDIKTAAQWNNSVFKANNHYYFPIPEAQMKFTTWDNNAGY